MKGNDISWFSYIKFGIIKYTRRTVMATMCKLILMCLPVWKDIQNYKKEAKKIPHFTKGYRQYYKFLSIYHNIRKYKPQYVLECGSGLSTIIILRALKENGSGKLISVDEDEKFGNYVSKIAGGDFKVNISPSRPGNYKGISGDQYTAIPEYPYDFLFIDGPQTKEVDLDTFYVLEKNPNARMLIDCRIKTIDAMRKFYPTKYSYLTNMGYINFK